jgi:hypothetical protein
MDPISSVQWGDPRSYLLALGLGLAAVGWWAYGQRDRHKWQAKATELGWTYKDYDASLVSPGFYLDSDGRFAESSLLHNRVDHVIRGSRSGLQLTQFSVTVARGGGESSPIRVTAVRTNVDAGLPRLLISGGNPRGRDLKKKVGPRMQVGSDLFQAIFVVRGRNSEFAASLLDPQMQEWLCEDGTDVEFETSGPWVFVIAKRFSSRHAEWEQDLLVGFVERIPPSIFEKYKRRVRTAARPGAEKDTSAGSTDD